MARLAGHTSRRWILLWRRQALGAAPALLVIHLLLASLLIAETAPMPQAQARKRDGARSYVEQVDRGTLAPAARILLVELSYNARSTPELRITGVTELNGYVPSPPEVDDPYAIELLDPGGTLLRSAPIAIPNVVFAAPPLPGTDGNGAHEGSVELTSVEFALVLPAVDGAASLQIRSPRGEVRDRFSLVGVRRVDNVPQFQTRIGDDLRPREPRADASGRDEGRRTRSGGAFLDITFIGDDYSPGEMGRFHAQVAQMARHLLTYEPFSTRAPEVRIHSIDNAVDLGCLHSAAIERVVLCDWLEVTRQVSFSGAPWDQIVVLWDTTVYGGSGGAISAVAAGHPSANYVFVHELAHSFARLADEYLLSDPLQATDTNCSPVNPQPAWAGVVAARDYVRECNFPHFYRSSWTSIMRSLNPDSRFFNAISRVILSRALDRLAVDPDPTAAVLRIDRPTDGGRIKGKKRVTVAVSSGAPMPPVMVEVLVCPGVSCSGHAARVIGSDASAPYVVTWRAPKQGRVTFLARGIWADRSSSFSEPVSLAVKKAKEKRKKKRR